MEGGRVPSSGQHFDSKDARTTGTDGTEVDMERKGPRTITINHPGRNLHRKEYVDPQEAYAARYGSFFYADL